jgi:hypothetical protein
MSEIYTCKECGCEMEFHYDHTWDQLVVNVDDCQCIRYAKPYGKKSLDLAFEKITKYMTAQEKLNYE